MELKNFFAQDDQGNKLPGANCYVYVRGTETLAVGVVKANGVILQSPFAADSDGLVQFAAPNGLYDLRVVRGKRDYRISVQFNDVADTLAIIEAAVQDATTARDAAQLLAGIVPSVEAGLAATANTAYKYFSLQSSDGDYLTLYHNDNGNPVLVGTYPSAGAVQAVLKLIAQQDSSVIVAILDEFGFAFGAIEEDGFSLPGLQVSRQTLPGTRFQDRDGFGLWEIAPERTSFGSLSWCSVPYEGLWSIDEMGFLLNDLSSPSKDIQTPLPNSTAYIAQEICGVDGVPLTLYVDGLLEVRDDSDYTRATLAADIHPVILSSSESIRFTPSELGAAAKLYTRPARGDASTRSVLNLTVRSAPNPPVGPAPAPRILLFADSIGNHQGPMLLNQFLTEWGYAPSFIGTYPSSEAESDGWNRSGFLSEARQSWSGDQYTYKDTTRTPIAAGAEAAYLAGTKPNMSASNPFLRVATSSDRAEFVKNGYIFDPADYQARFGLQAPDIIINALGTNDIRDQTAQTIYNTIYENDILFHTQFRAAWPYAKIIRCMPGAARNAGDAARNRDALWTSHYIPLIRAILNARKQLSDPGISVASSWAFYSQEAGYMLGAGKVDPVTGSIQTELSDWLHPQGSTRRQYYQYLAGHVACVAAGLI